MSGKNVTRKKRILFITPLASLTGSEKLLGYVLKGLDPDRYEMAVASYRNGELLQQLPHYVKVYVVPGDYKLVDKIAHQLGFNPIKTALGRIQKAFKADLWYLNTIVLPEAAGMAVELGVPFVTHFHEMPLSYVYCNKEEFRTIIDKSRLLIGCSRATCDGIREAGGGEKVRLFYEFISGFGQQLLPQKSLEIREQLGIGPRDFVWMMSGTTSERKGFDFFPDIALQLNLPNVHLVWLGEQLADGYVEWVANRITNLPSRTKVHLLGIKKEDYPYYLNMADGFALTSRQDPFPLVMIEAASLGKPIVAFPSGGVSEFIEERMGYVTADLNAGQMVVLMKQIMDNPGLMDPAKSKEIAARYSADKSIPLWEEMMSRVLTD